MSKRERSKNFSEEEKQSVLLLVEKYLAIIENKKTDGVTTKEKNAAWEDVANRFNAIAKTGTRTGTQLKLLYESLKKQAKKHKADDKVEAYKTGGGTYISNITNTDNKLIAMLGPQLKPLSNVYDSNAEIDDIVYSTDDNLEPHVESPASTIILPATSPVEPVTENLKSTFINRIKTKKNKHKTYTNLEDVDKVNKNNLFMLKKKYMIRNLKFWKLLNKRNY